MANLTLKNNSGGTTSITADNFIGNSSTSSKWLTARTISLTGSVTGSAAIDGSGNISISTTTNHNHDSVYVNVSGDSMTGRLTLNVYNNTTAPSQQSLVINGIETTDVGLSPGISMHIPNYTYSSLKLISDGSWRFYNSACNGYMPVYASTFHGNLDGTSNYAHGAGYANYIIGNIWNTDITQHNPNEGTWIFASSYVSNTTGLFATSNNANAILTINKHPGYYDSQLGFSANGNIYYRNFNGVQQDTTTAWKQIAFTDGYVANAGNATTASGISSVSPVLAAAGESNTLQAIDNYYYYTDTTLPIYHSILSIPKALDFQWYNSHWRIGNLRGWSTASSGFGFSYSSDNSIHHLYSYINLAGCFWSKRLGSDNYGPTLPSASTRGEIFFVVSSR